MKVLIKQAKILDSSSEFNGEIKDVLLINGKISDISNEIKSTDHNTVQIRSKNIHLSKGWIDLKAHFCDPGNEYKETLSSGLDGAASGGFTHVAVLPSTKPVIDHKSLVEYVLRKSESHAVELIPMACITKSMQGRELSEMNDLKNAGAILFSDDSSTPEAQTLKNALLYGDNHECKIIVNSFNNSLSSEIQVNEGMASLKTGLKADPEISEIIEIEKHIRLVEYTEGSLHLSGISTKEGVKLIKAAKKKGLKITADVHVMNLCFNESKVVDFDTSYKTLPVLRSQKNVEALWKGLEDNTIDFVVSDHRPSVKEDKEREFEDATFGAPQLQTLFSALNSKDTLQLEKLVQILSDNTRNFIQKPSPSIKIGNLADLTIFDPSMEFSFDSNQRKENKLYSPFQHDKLTGKVLGIVNNNKLVLNQ
ncbi:dihydroorotase [Crocinitomicaceae bacterium]|nr:dihydroorotase [Crocinitomicaceae bacterium]